MQTFSDADFCNCGGKRKEIDGGFVCLNCHKAIACYYEFEEENGKHPARKIHLPLGIPICYLHEQAAEEYYRGFSDDVY